MFAGIVEASGVVSQIRALAQGARLLTIRSAFFAESAKAGSSALGAEPFSALGAEPGEAIKIGDSVCISGVCLTVVEIQGEELSFELSSETLRCTTLSSWQIGREVNLELSLRFGERVDGHFVQGHVDGVVEVLGREVEGTTIRLELTLPTQVQNLIVPKGAVSLDGVSLTVGEVDRERFSVYIITHTAAVTTLKDAHEGSLLNVEADCMARYVVSLTESILLKRGL